VSGISSKTKYFTQRRISLPGDPGKFEKCCDGHETLYEAMRCAENAHATYLGMKPSQPVHPIIEAIDAELRAQYLALISIGGTMELCVSKYTVTREVIEEFGFVTREKVQPKKEVP